jgi:hypothetical protein
MGDTILYKSFSSSLHGRGIQVCSDSIHSFHRFQGLHWSRCVLVYTAECFGTLSSAIQFKLFTQFCLCSSILFVLPVFSLLS